MSDQKRMDYYNNAGHAFQQEIEEARLKDEQGITAEVGELKMEQ